MKTGSHLKIKNFGTYAMGVRLEGNPKKPEPPEFRVVFPGGDVSITRTSNNEYWVHVHVNHKGDMSWSTNEPGDVAGKISDARLDIHGKHASECNVGDFEDPNLYHLAVLVSPEKT